MQRRARWLSAFRPDPSTEALCGERRRKAEEEGRGRTPAEVADDVELAADLGLERQRLVEDPLGRVEVVLLGERPCRQLVVPCQSRRASCRSVGGARGRRQRRRREEMDARAVGTTILGAVRALLSVRLARMSSSGTWALRSRSLSLAAEGRERQSAGGAPAVAVSNASSLFQALPRERPSSASQQRRGGEG